MGFTLIELSIVLVILGLIVGGIVGGRALVKQARLQTVIRDVKGYQTALNAFRLQFDALPGDFKEGFDYWDDGTDNICGSDDSTNNGCNGNGDGILGYVDGLVGNNINELTRAWFHLQLAEVMPPSIHGYDWTVGGQRYREIVTQADGSSTHVGNTVPLSKYGENTGYALFNPAVQAGQWTPASLYGKSGTWITLMSTITGVALPPAGSFNRGSMSPADVLSLDKKLDDGKPGTGNIIGARFWNSGSGNSGNCTDSTYGNDDAPWEMDTHTSPETINYLLTNTNTSCIPMFFYGN